MKWTLFDYGVGNLHSLRKAVVAQGRSVDVTSDPAELEHADAILLPGVGAFGAVMDALEPARHALIAHHAEGKPLIGICIGMQALYQASEEDPEHVGLGIVPGRIRALPRDAGKVPHMGWNTIQPADGDVDRRLRLALQGAGHVYYVHSYAAPADGACATTTYGVPFAAAIQRGKTVGFQFHPEKSSRIGARILGAALDTLEAP